MGLNLASEWSGMPSKEQFVSKSKFCPVFCKNYWQLNAFVECLFPQITSFSLCVCVWFVCVVCLCVCGVCVCLSLCVCVCGVACGVCSIPTHKPHFCPQSLVLLPDLRLLSMKAIHWFLFCRNRDKFDWTKFLPAGPCIVCTICESFVCKHIWRILLLWFWFTGNTGGGVCPCVNPKQPHLVWILDARRAQNCSGCNCWLGNFPTFIATVGSLGGSSLWNHYFDKATC